MAFLIKASLVLGMAAAISVSAAAASGAFAPSPLPLPQKRITKTLADYEWTCYKWIKDSKANAELAACQKKKLSAGETGDTVFVLWWLQDQPKGPGLFIEVDHFNLGAGNELTFTFKSPRRGDENKKMKADENSAKGLSDLNGKTLTSICKLQTHSPQQIICTPGEPSSTYTVSVKPIPWWLALRKTLKQWNDK